MYTLPVNVPVPKAGSGVLQVWAEHDDSDTQEHVLVITYRRNLLYAVKEC